MKKNNENLMYLDDYLSGLKSNQDFKNMIQMKRKLARLKYQQEITELGIEAAQQIIKQQDGPNIFK